MDSRGIILRPDVATMAYSNCRTRTVNLFDLDLPGNATERDFREIYQRISKANTLEARRLTDAVTSVTIGLAPPVAFPTETVYGLGADATNHANIAGIFAAKGRPSDNPLIVHVSSKEHLERLTGETIPAIYDDLINDYWPGPLTILVPVPQDSVFAHNVHPGQNTIGFRVPESKYARFFIAATDRPIAAPSANSSGKPSPTTAQHVMDDLKGKINFILDGGSCDVGVESTVVDGLHDPPLVLRPGGVSLDDLRAHGKKYSNSWAQTEIGYKQASHQQNGTSNSHSDSEEAPRAPGMKYKHYAPHGRLILLDGKLSANLVKSKLDHLLANTPTNTPQTLAQTSPNGLTPSAINIAILSSTSWASFANILTNNSPINPLNSAGDTITTTTLSQPQKTTYQTHNLYSIHLGTTPKQVAQTLFAALRTCDRLGCHYIFAEAPAPPRPEDGVDHHYDAVVERMRKAASEIIEDIESD
jgi:L-threonylcarbamoyladenylate synthase